MSFLKSHPIFSAVMFVLLALAGAEIWLLWSLRTEEAVLELTTEQKIGQINVLQRQNPALTDDNVLLAREDLEQSKVVLATMLRSLGVTRQDELEYFKDEPADEIDAYFDISGFVERMRAEAGEADVQLSAADRFGFSTYENVGPEPALIQPVYRQRLIIEYLLHRLFDARPQALVSVQRERPVAAESTTVAASTPARQPRNQQAPRANASAEGPASDFFVVDPQVSARTPGYVDTMAFRIVFRGQTAALRGFMNALAEPGLPLVVRSVEVRTLSGVSPGSTDRARANEGAARSNRDPNASTAAVTPTEMVSANVPIVAENDAQFTVTVEMFEVLVE